MKLQFMAIAILSIAISACGGADSGGKKQSGQTQGTQNFPAAQNGELPAAVEVTMTCGTSQSSFGLALLADGSARVLSDGVVTSGNYSTSGNQLRIQLSSGVNAQSSSHLMYGGILAGMNLTDNLGNQNPCVTRTHSRGQRFNQSEAFRCGRLNIGGESADTFNLYADGSSDWVNVFELPGGADTTYRTRVGTYIFDSASGRLGLIYKGIDSDDVFTFEAQISQGQVRVVAASAAGDGADTPNKTCTVL